MSLGILRAIGFISFFDRFAAAPMLVVLARQAGITLEQSIQLTTVYALLYALGQPLWGMVSDRIGRVAVLRIALAGTVLAGIACISIAGYIPLLIARAAAGLMVGALYPTLLTILGDSLQGRSRFHEISNLQTVSALGTTAATLVAGAIASWSSWRVVFGITVVIAAALLVSVLRAANTVDKRSRGQLCEAIKPWPLWLYFLSFVEGAVLVGTLTYIVPAMEWGGTSVALAGLLAATYGLGLIGGSQLTKVMQRLISRLAIMVIGVCCLVSAYAIAALSQDAAFLTATATLIGLSNAFAHSSMQGWITELSPTARATTVSIFACSLFLGGAAATGFTAATAAVGEFGVIFAGAAVTSGVFGILATVSYSRWSRRPGPVAIESAVV